MSLSHGEIETAVFILPSLRLVSHTTLEKAVVHCASICKKSSVTVPAHCFKACCKGQNAV